MFRGNEKTLKEAINEMLESYKLKGKLNEVKAINSWEKLMGKVISNRTTEIFISSRKLYIRLNSAPLREELSYARTKIIDMINKEVGEKVIEEVILL
jgi:hypothetical protein